MKSRLPMIIDYTKNPIRLQRQNFGHSLWGPSAPPELPAVDTPLERWCWTRSAVYSSVRLAPRTHSGWSWWEASKPPSQSLLALHPESARSARSTFGSMHHHPRSTESRKSRWNPAQSLLRESRNSTVMAVRSGFHIP